jgi:hypothetical protein
MIDLSDYPEHDRAQDDFGNFVSRADLNNHQNFKSNCDTKLHHTDKEHRETLPPTCNFEYREFDELYALEDFSVKLHVEYESADESRNYDGHLIFICRDTNPCISINLLFCDYQCN